MTKIKIRLKRDARTSRGRLMRGFQGLFPMAEAAALIAGGHAELVKDPVGEAVLGNVVYVKDLEPD